MMSSQKFYKSEISLDTGSGFSKIFDSGYGSERKTQNSAGVDSGNPDPVPPLSSCKTEHKTVDIFKKKKAGCMKCTTNRLIPK